MLCEFINMEEGGFNENIKCFGKFLSRLARVIIRFIYASYAPLNTFTTLLASIDDTFVLN